MNSAGQIKCNVLTCGWNHHLEGGGWGDICKKLKKLFHDSRSPVDMYTAYEYQVRDRVKRPYVAFFHQVVSGYERSLEKILSSKTWKHNQKFFLGGFVFSKNQQAYLESKKISRPIQRVIHPTPIKVKKWNLKSFLKNPTFLHVGVHCRNIDFFLAVAKRRRQQEKYVLLSAKERNYATYLTQYQWLGAKIQTRLNKKEYNKALTSSVVFINLFDAAANNTVLECIARGTPILINNVGGVEDYLGKAYPLYYSSRKHAEQIINKLKRDPNILSRASAYLLKRRYRFLTQRFLQDVGKGLKKMIQ